MITNLIPVHINQKSFYGKALVITSGNIIELQSYNTIICQYDTEKKVLVNKAEYHHLTSTTLKHLKEFCRQCNVEYTNKQQYVKTYM